MSKEMKKLMEGLQSAVSYGEALPDLTITEEEISEVRKWWGTDSYKRLASNIKGRGEQKAADTEIDVSGPLKDIDQASMAKRIEVVSSEIQQTIDDLRSLDLDAVTDEAFEKILSGDLASMSSSEIRHLAIRAEDDVRAKKGWYFVSLLKYMASWRFLRDAPAVGAINYASWLSFMALINGSGGGFVMLAWFFIVFPLSFMIPIGSVQATERGIYNKVKLEKHRGEFKKQMADRLEGLITYLEAEKAKIEKGDFSGLRWDDRKGSDEDHGRKDAKYDRDIWNDTRY